MVRKLMYGSLVVIIVIIAVVLYQKQDDVDPKLGQQLPEKQMTLTEHAISDDQLTLTDKIGQMIFAGIDGTIMTDETQRLIRDYKVGGIILFAENIDSQAQTAGLLDEMREENQDNTFPLFFGVDQEGGTVERLSGEVETLPPAADIGEKNDMDVSFLYGETLAKEMQLFGFNVDFAPVLDVNSNPNNPVIGDRSFGETSDVVVQHGLAVMDGLQSENIITSVKHFPGHGDTDTDSHLELPQVNKSLAELKQLELIPFQKAVESGADMVMVAHILLPKIDPDYPASISEKVIGDILRDDLDYDGIVITDDMTMAGLTDNFDIGDAAVRSIQAGSDIILVAHEYDTIVAVYEAIEDAVEQGELTEERLDESLQRIKQLKDDYNVGKDQNKRPDRDDINTQIDQIHEHVNGQEI